MTGYEKKQLANDGVLLFILAKVDQYKGEKEYFENKYRTTFELFENQLHSVENRENFLMEDDLNDWEFAVQSLEYWQNEFLKVSANEAVA